MRRADYIDDADNSNDINKKQFHPKFGAQGKWALEKFEMDN